MPTPKEYNLNALKSSASYDGHKVPLQTYIFAIESKDENLEKAIKSKLLKMVSQDDWVISTGKADLVSIASTLDDNDFAKEVIKAIGATKLEKLFRKATGSFENGASNFYNMILRNKELSSFFITNYSHQMKDRAVRYNILATLINKNDINQLDEFLQVNPNFLESIKVNKNITSPLVHAQDLKAINYLVGKGFNLFDYKEEKISLRIIDYLFFSQLSHASNILKRYGKNDNFNPTQINRIQKFIEDLITNYTNEKDKLITEKNMNLYSTNIFNGTIDFKMLNSHLGNNNLLNLEEKLLQLEVDKYIIDKTNDSHKFSVKSETINNQFNQDIIFKYLNFMEEKNISPNNFLLSKIQFINNIKIKNSSYHAYQKQGEELNMLIERLKINNALSDSNEINNNKKRLKI